MARAKAVDIERCQVSLHLRQLRKQRQLTQAEVAEGLNYSRSRYSMLEKYPLAQEDDLISRLNSERGRHLRSLREDNDHSVDQQTGQRVQDDDRTLVAKLAQLYGLGVSDLRAQLRMVDAADPPDLDDPDVIWESYSPTVATANDRPRWGSSPYPVLPQSSIRDRLNRENDMVRERAVATIYLDDGLVDEGFFVCIWTDEFAHGRDQVAVGDLMWVDTTEEGREPCADALYLVMSQAGQPFIRRAVVDHRKTTWLASDHYNQRIHKAFRWKVARVVGRLNKLSVVMQAARQQLEERHEQGKKRKR